METLGVSTRSTSKLVGRWYLNNVGTPPLSGQNFQSKSGTASYYNGPLNAFDVFGTTASVPEPSIAILTTLSAAAIGAFRFALGKQHPAVAKSSKF